MIVSKSKKFIFYKPMKTAGTSVQLNLWQQCDPTDLMNMMTATEYDEHQFEVCGNEDQSIHEHMPPTEYPKPAGYKAVSMVRNPWDAAVSYWYWQRTAPIETIVNNRIYKLNEFVHPDIDFYIRYEHLEEDYKECCKFLGIDYEPLKKTKNYIRTNKDYTKELTPGLVEKVRQDNPNVLNKFNYQYG